MNKRIAFAPTPSHLNILRAVRAAQAMVSPLQPNLDEIASIAKRHPSRVSRVLHIMQNKGWIEIKDTGGNGRYKIVFKVQIG